MIEKHNFFQEYYTDGHFLCKCINKSFQYFHNDITNYIIQNYFLNDSESKSQRDSYITYKAIKYHNFDFIILKNNINQFLIDFCKYGFTSIVNHLVEETDAVQYLNLEHLEARCSLIYKIIINEHLEILKKLLEKNVIYINAEFYYLNRKKSTQYKYNLLFFAASQNNYEMVQFLISQPNINLNNPFTTSLVLTSQSVVQEVNDIEDDPKCFWEWDNDSIDIEDTKTFTTFNGPKKFAPIKKTVLQLAVEYKNNKIVALLLSHPTINVNCETVIRRNYMLYEMSDWIVYRERTMQINKTPLITAIENEDLETVSILLTHPKIEVNLKSSRDFRHKYKLFNTSTQEKHLYSAFLQERKTPLCAAIITKNCDLVKFLLNHDDVDIDAQSVIINNFPLYLLTNNSLIEEREDPIIIMKNINEMKDQITEEITNPFNLASSQNNNDILDLLNTKKCK
ncbi:hypothetical protein M9Y10_018686 [Tritrichomonas musculus]|uniref:DUF3447 domain-containing protein n=1 Tax=Tritrichomonas musculus TaxID=1915356 RepID=A0ABR2HMD2_9EUKA